VVSPCKVMAVCAFASRSSDNVANAKRRPDSTSCNRSEAS
jgi:hypothetical protein